MAELTQVSTGTKAKKVFKKISGVLMVVVIVLAVVFTGINSLTYIAKIENFMSKDQYKAQLEEYARNDNLISDSLMVPSANIYAPMTFPEGVDFFETTKGEGIAVHPDGGKIEDSKTAVIHGSSYGYFWKEGQHKYIFTSLRAAKENDQIFIQHQDETSEYKVTGTEIVWKSKFDPKGDFDSDLILYTEWPTGINILYVVVYADRI